MAVCWLFCAAVFSYILSAERIADQRLLREADSFLTRRHRARESEQQEKRSKALLTAEGVQETPKEDHAYDSFFLPDPDDEIEETPKEDHAYDSFFLPDPDDEIEESSGPSTDVQAPVVLPKCSDGILQLNGVYEVKREEVVLVEEPSCRVNGSAELLLWATVRFQGNAVFTGQLSVKAAGDGEMNGPCIVVDGNLTLHPEARLSLQGCKNKADGKAGRGGCLHVDGDADLLGGQLFLRECEAEDPREDGDGGGIYVRGTLRSRNALVDAESCKACNGGSIYAFNDMLVSGGNVTIRESTARRGAGGAIYAKSMNVSGGDVTIRESTAAIEGGAIWARNNVVVSGGNVTIRESSTRASAGAICANNDMIVSDGNVTIEESRAFTNGGAIYALNDMIVSGGNVTIRESTASSRYRGSGGAIYAMNDMIVSGGNVTIRESTAESGGCIYTYGSFEQSNGTVSLQGCTAKHEGGGMLSGNITIEDTAMLTIRDSQADKGGGVFADWITNKAQQLQVSTCSAMSSGGCFYIKDGAEFTAPLLLRDCDAKGTGGAIYAQRKLVAQQINCSRCNAPTSGFLQLESGSASIGSLTLQSSSSLPPASSTVAAGANATVTLGTVDCRQEPGCALVVSRMQLAQLLCHRGESLHTLADDDGAACRECPTNEVRLVAFDKDQNASCTPCPTMENITIFCTSTEMLLPPGYMVDFDRDVASNLSAWYRCPNEMACRGGHFNASSVPGERAQELVPMCQEGYGGPGCTICTEGHARADADILSCVPCANWTTSPKQVVWYVSFFLLKNLALFASAVVSVEGSGGKRATSATLLNQAMSFAAVAGVTMSGAMQTGTFKNDLDHAAQVVLQMLTVPASVAQGQGSSDAGSSSMSGQCLLQLLNVDSSIHHVHMLMSLWPALLVAGLAVIKGGWLAAVVGSNVFLPAFIAGFGKYLVAFRLRPESENEALHLDFLPPGPQMSSHVPLRIAAVLGAIVGFSALSVCSWIYAVRTRSPKETRPHVAYLIQAYRPECAIWEVERLMRKVLLALVATVLPVTLSPALQMEAVTLVLIASLVAHLYFWPYQADDWNRAEIGLLIVSLTITGMTTCLIANDLHWAKSALTQRLLVFLICAIAGGICIVMMVAFAMAYLAERRQRAEAKKAEDASAARPLSPRREAAAAESRTDD